MSTKLAEGPELVPCPGGRLVIPNHPGEAAAGVRLSLVIPTLNESQSVPTLVRQLEELLDPVLGEAYELIVVDDDSADRTWAVALQMTASHPRLRVMRRQGERGLGTAVVRGWQVARGSILGVMDGDLQHPPSINLELLSRIEQGAQLATASRHVRGGGVSDWSLRRRTLSRGAQLLGLLVVPGVLGRLTDPMSGYFMLQRACLTDVELHPLGYKVLLEVLARGRVDWIAEVGYVFRERLDGESKITWHLYRQYLVQLLRLRRATRRTR